MGDVRGLTCAFRAAAANMPSPQRNHRQAGDRGGGVHDHRLTERGRPYARSSDASTRSGVSKPSEKVAWTASSSSIQRARSARRASRTSRAAARAASSARHGSPKAHMRAGTTRSRRPLTRQGRAATDPRERCGTVALGGRGRLRPGRLVDQRESRVWGPVLDLGLRLHESEHRPEHGRRSQGRVGDRYQPQSGGGLPRADRARSSPHPADTWTGLAITAARSSWPRPMRPGPRSAQFPAPVATGAGTRRGRRRTPASTGGRYRSRARSHGRSSRPLDPDSRAATGRSPTWSGMTRGDPARAAAGCPDW